MSYITLHCYDGALSSRPSAGINYRLRKRYRGAPISRWVVGWWL